MKLNLDVAGRVLSSVYAGAAALLPLLIDQHVISAAIGTDIGVSVAAIAAGWHGRGVIARRDPTVVRITPGSVSAPLPISGLSTGDAP